jgi:hypothetical protein
MFRFAHMTGAVNKNSLIDRWADTLRRKSGCAALLSPDGETLRTFADIDAEARAFPALETGAVVAIQIGNNASWPALLLA